jgi:DNA-directed RNA polymerase specialized sigma24 family protein
VRKRARGLIGNYGFRRSDRDEIEQALYLKLVGRLDQADPNDPKWKAFVAKTVSRHIASMIRDRFAAKRDHRRVCSIHVVIGADEAGPVELAATLLEHETPTKRSLEQRTEQETAELRMDVVAGIGKLCDQRHWEFCERLKHDSISQVARDMNVPRTTLNAWLTKIRSRFEELGLGDYMNRSSSVV